MRHAMPQPEPYARTSRCRQQKYLGDSVVPEPVVIMASRRRSPGIPYRRAPSRHAETQA